MLKLSFVQPDGSQETVDVGVGYSVMEAAVNNDIAGIDADCRGSCACATCHVYVDGDWMERAGPPHELEREMLELLSAAEVRPDSRLSCQLRMTAALDGLVVRIPG